MHTGRYVYINRNACIYKYMEPDNYTDRFTFGYGGLDGEFFEHPIKYGGWDACDQRNTHFDRDKYSGLHADGYAAEHGNQYTGKYLDEYSRQHKDNNGYKHIYGYAFKYGR